MKTELAVLIPTRGRPGNVRKVISAWDFTNAWDVADLILVADEDDPEYQGYIDLMEETRHPDTGQHLIKIFSVPVWVPMVEKLNAAAVALAESGDYFALGFAGDDHLPQTINWVKTYLSALHKLGTGMVYGDDGFQGSKLSTEWAVTADAVLALGKMVPAPVEHMYSDNSMMDLFGEAGALRYLPQVRIEHMHPIAKKAEQDEQYARVNSRQQFAKDKALYDNWRGGQLSADLATLKALQPGRPGAPRKEKKMSRSPFPRHFKQVKGLTPEEVGIALADFAMQVPADQAIVELGTFHGRTALQLAWGAQQGNGAHVWAIDPWDLPGNVYGSDIGDMASARSWARYWFRGLGYASRITQVQAFGAEAAREWVTSPELMGRGNRSVGLLFVDGDHSYEGARGDIEAWAPHLAPGARIAVDDYIHPDYPEVKKAVDDLVSEGVLGPVEVYHDRLAVARLAEAAGKRSYGGVPAPTAVTSEGVSPSPYPAVPGQVAVPDALEPVYVEPVDTDESIDRMAVAEGEVEGVPAGARVADLNTYQLRSLAKARDIQLGVRKDKRAAMLAAIREGR